MRQTLSYADLLNEKSIHCFSGDHDWRQQGRHQILAFFDQRKIRQRLEARIANLQNGTTPTKFTTGCRTV